MDPFGSTPILIEDALHPDDGRHLVFRNADPHPCQVFRLGNVAVRAHKDAAVAKHA